MPSVINLASDTCKSCSAQGPCKDRALQALDRVKGVLKVDHMIQRLEYADSFSYALRPWDHTRIAAAPKKLRSRLESLMRQGFHVRAVLDLRKGRNPFPATGAKHMHLAGEMLLMGGLDKRVMRQLCMERFGWTKETAASEVSNAVALLFSLGLVQQGHNGRLEIAK